MASATGAFACESPRKSSFNRRLRRSDLVCWSRQAANGGKHHGRHDMRGTTAHSLGGVCFHQVHPDRGIASGVRRPRPKRAPSLVPIAIVESFKDRTDARSRRKSLRRGLVRSGNSAVAAFVLSPFVPARWRLVPVSNRDRPAWRTDNPVTAVPLRHKPQTSHVRMRAEHAQIRRA